MPGSPRIDRPAETTDLALPLPRLLMLDVSSMSSVSVDCSVLGLTQVLPSSLQPLPLPLVLLSAPLLLTSLQLTSLLLTSLLLLLPLLLTLVVLIDLERLSQGRSSAALIFRASVQLLPFRISPP